MSIIQGTAKASGDASFYPFEIGQSLRFDGSSYLSKSFSESNRRTMTYSFWSKQSTLGVSSQIFSSGGSVSDQIFFGNNDIFRIYLSGGYRIETTAVFRDTSAWNHFVISIDTTNSYVRLYQNGSQIATGSISANTDIKLNDAGTHYIGRYAASDAERFSGYMAEINFIDGTALTPTSFGETKNGVWIPKNPSGLTYGTNGFRLSFALSDFNTSGSAVTDPHGSSTNVPDGYVADASGSGNHWNVN